jgi:hypothetical protein
MTTAWRAKAHGGVATDIENHVFIRNIPAVAIEIFEKDSLWERFNPDIAGGYSGFMPKSKV